MKGGSFTTLPESYSEYKKRLFKFVEIETRDLMVRINDSSLNESDKKELKELFIKTIKANSK